MKTGQIYIATVVIIGFIIAGVINLTYVLTLETQSMYSETTSVPTIKRNIERELITTTYMDPYNDTRINNTISNFKNSSETQGVNIEVKEILLDEPSECDANLEKSMEPLNTTGKGRRFNVTIHDPGEMKTQSIFTVCWS